MKPIIKQKLAVSEKKHGETGKVYYVFILPGIILILLHLLAAFTQTPLLWGIDGWGYLPGIFPFLFLFIGILSFLPGFQNTVMSIFKKTSTFFKKTPIFIWVLIAGIIFYMFRQSTFLLGDGFLQIRQIESVELISKQEPYFDIFFHKIIFRFLNPIIGISGQQIYQWMSILCGVMTISVILLFLKQVFEKKEHRLFLGGLLFTAGSVQLFFGYVEAYTFVNSFLIFFLLSTILMLKRGKNSSVPALFLSVAVIFHPQAIMLIPGILYAYYVINKKTFSEWIKPLSVFISVLVLFIFLFALEGFTPADFFQTYSGGGKLLPLTSKENLYGILSLKHLIDCLNEIILIAPISIFLIIIVIKIRDIQISKTIIFLVLCCMGALFFMAVFHARIGFARDWDLFAFCAFPLTLLAGILLINFMYEDFSRLIFPVFTLMLLHTVPWIFINSNEPLSIKRFENLAKTGHWSNYAKGAAYDELNSYYNSIGEYEKSLKYAEEAYHYNKNDRYMHKMAMSFTQLGQPEKAVRIYRELLSQKPKSPLLHFNYGMALLTMNFLEMAENEFKISLKLNPKQKAAHFNLGVIFFRKRQYNNAIREFKNELSINPEDTDSYIYLAEIFSIFKNDKSKGLDYLNSAIDNSVDRRKLAEYYKRTGEVEKAIDLYKELINSDPSSSALHLGLGSVYESKKFYDNALIEFEKAVNLKPDVKLGHFNIGVIYGKKKMFDQAISEFEKELIVNPKDEIALFYLAELYWFHKKDIITALKYLEKAKKHGYNPQNVNDLEKKIKSGSPEG